MLPQTVFNRVGRDAMESREQAMWDGAQALHGDTTFVEVMANAPETLRWYIDRFYGELFHSGRLDRQLVELVRLRLANVHGCAFCNRADRIAALDAGLSEAEVAAIGDYGEGPYSDAQKAALELTDVMVLTNPAGMVDKPLYDRLRRHFSDGELVELGMIMAVLTGVAKFIFAFDLVEKEDTCPFASPVKA